MRRTTVYCNDCATHEYLCLGPTQGCTCACHAPPLHTHPCPLCKRERDCAGTHCDPTEPRECITCSNCRGW